MGAITAKSAILALEQTASVWGTIVAPGAGDLIKAETIGPILEPRDMVPDPAAGYAWIETLKAARKNVGPEISLIPRYEGRFWSHIAQLMGLDTKSGVGDPYSHVFSLLDAIDGSDNFYSLALQLGPAAGELLFEWPSVKPTGFTLEGPNGQGYMSLALRTIADCVHMGADCTVTTTNFDSVTHLEVSSAMPAQIPFGALRFRLNWDAGALDSGDNLAIKRFALTFNRGFDREWASRGAQASEWMSAEPIENGIPECSLQIELGDFNALTYMEAHQDETTCKAEAFWSLSANHDLKIEFPLLRIQTPEASINGPNRIPQTLTLVPLLAAAAPTGMTCTNWQMTLRSPNATAYE